VGERRKETARQGRARHAQRRSIYPFVATRNPSRALEKETKRPSGGRVLRRDCGGGGRGERLVSTVD